MRTDYKRNASSDRIAVVVAFLEAAVAGGAVATTELDQKARGAGLLSGRQGITHAKVFKRAKKTLGIKSVRDGFGAAGEWSWVLPQNDPRSDVAKSTGHLSPNRPPPVIYGELGLEPTQGRVGVPREWIDGIARVHRQRPPADVPPHRWLQFVADCERFLDQSTSWAAQAAALGWDASSLFGCAPTQPLAHMQVAGLMWALRGRKIVRLYPDWDSIEDSAAGSRYVFNRRVTFGVPIALPWMLR